MSVTQTQVNRHFTFNVNLTPQILPPNQLDSLKTISEEHKISQSKHTRPNTASNLPINFFHSPGQYNKMLIRCTPPETTSFAEKKLGLVKNLQFVNQPLFQKEKQKRYERVNNYCQSMRQKKRATMSQNASLGQSCGCCCCDNFCSECAKTSICQFTCKEKLCKDQKMLIDIPSMKKASKNRVKKVIQSIEVSSELSDPHFCCKKTKNNRFHIDQLVNESVMKQIEKKREKQLSELSVKQKQQYKEQFNRLVRQNNRAMACSRLSVEAKPKSRPKSKKAIGEQYWNQIKDVVHTELQKQKFDKSYTEMIKNKLKPRQQEEHVCLKKSSRNLTKQQMEKNRKKNGHMALNQERKCKLQQKERQKSKAKSLLALAAEQEEIIKNNPKKKFKPTKDMVDNAFKELD